ncbi:hypothetical protein LTR36_008508 [Oleoguttula mirabilis]|uniref:NmrA-like domain-containing protein n=1 Tax=Oleoguttula mirabilis TaxID=1507867 RepID=A0AAV9JT52_9PEZI|nr:hypothetical protein LTR36_008508 [Oleoguttula mirabilis]
MFAQAKPDIVISTTSGGSYDTQKLLIDCAVEAKVTRFVPAEFGHDSLNEKIQERLPPLREKARTIEYLNRLSAGGRISWVAIATGCLLDYGLQSGNLGFDLKWQSATLHGNGDERFAASSVHWLGQVVRSVITHWDQVQNRYLYVAGTVTSSNEVLQCLEDASGKQWQAGRAETAECVREAERRIERGFPDAAMFLMERSLLYDQGLAALQPFSKQDAKSTLGLQEERLKDVVQSVLHHAKHHSSEGCGCD